MNLFLIALCKIVLFASRTLNLGSGSTWPGHIAMETNPNFVRQVLKKNPGLKTVLIAGTNGKTTTSLMLQKILEYAGLKVFRNEAGANLLNGIASSIIANSNIFGKLDFDIAIFEIDENNFPFALEQINAHSIVLLNLFRDQLDRYGEVNTIAQKWQEALLLLRGAKQQSNLTLYTNGDDPKLSFIAQSSNLQAYYFGIEPRLMANDKNPYDVDFTYCPQCQTKLMYEKVSYSHLGRFACPKCGFTNPETQTFTTLPHTLIGKYNIYNTNAAALVAKQAFNVPLQQIHTALKDFKPAFGRQETIKYKNRDVLILLSKNPAGFNQSIEAVNDVIASRAKQSPNISLVLNDRIPDGRDVSWIWDVDFENLPQDSKIFISGDRVYDMALRLKYAELPAQTNDELKDAIDAAIEQTKPDETLFILPTYSAMLETRKILTGRSIL